MKESIYKSYTNLTNAFDQSASASRSIVISTNLSLLNRSIPFMLLQRTSNEENTGRFKKMWMGAIFSGRQVKKIRRCNFFCKSPKNLDEARNFVQDLCHHFLRWNNWTTWLQRTWLEGGLNHFFGSGASRLFFRCVAEIVKKQQTETWNKLTAANNNKFQQMPEFESGLRQRLCQV